MRLCIRWAAFCTLLFVLSGCGKSKLHPVKGIVTLNGKPLEKATVLFISEEADGRDVFALTDAEGKFELSTHTPKDGAMAGSYKIVIQYSEPDEGPLLTFATPADAQKASADKPPKEPILPSIYTDPGQTILKQQVPTEGFVKIELQAEKR